jgi:SAM-dependent methyltransferase
LSAARPLTIIRRLQPIATFLQRLADACADDSFARLTLSSPVDPDAAVQRIVARLVEIQGARCLSFTLREAKRDTTQNVPLAEVQTFVERELRRFRAAMLATTDADWQLQLGDGDGAGKLIRHKPSQKSKPARAHDESKKTYLGADALPWLQVLDLVDQQGRTKPKLADKKAQLDRYVEILAHLAQDCGWGAGEDQPALRLVDVGCGKGHLTFAAWHLVANVLRRPVAALGVEARPELVEQANARAAAVGAQGLRFVAGDIGTAPLPAVDALVALHACNTATDHAIRRGIEARAKLVVVAPCCHQEVRPQLGSPAPLGPVLRHGFMAERMAEWATDGLRALVLEWAGYKTKVVEFVSSEHTGKNVMIAGVRDDAPRSDAQVAEARARIGAFKAFFGIGAQALDPLLQQGAGR